ncbi:MAG: hypothetical protein J2P25_08355 [Nocardiopsaceae bacterium]|nr:hypothetical protein [Nocardiopsaceae bacterium]
MAVGTSEDDRKLFAEELKAIRVQRGWSVIGVGHAWPGRIGRQPGAPLSDK